MTNVVLGFDSTQLQLITLPDGGRGYVIVCYADGIFANEDLARQLFPNAWILPLTCLGAVTLGIDWEPGNTQPDPTSWWQAAKAYYPCPVFYADLSDMRDTILPDLDAANAPRDEYGIFTAHPTGIEHICGPKTCGQLDRDADGTQWDWNPRGVNLDEDVFNASFFAPILLSPSIMEDQMVSTLNSLGDLHIFVINGAGGIDYCYQPKATSKWSGGGPDVGVAGFTPFAPPPPNGASFIAISAAQNDQDDLIITALADNGLFYWTVQPHAQTKWGGGSPGEHIAELTFFAGAV
jgi:hypothetical protein